MSFAVSSLIALAIRMGFNPDGPRSTSVSLPEEFHSIGGDRSTVAKNRGGGIDVSPGISSRNG
jgi:hypothetical protein